MLYSVIIPVYNEKETIREILKRIEEININKEIILIDDGSVDGTRDILLTEYEQKPNYKVILQPENKGKGAAIRAAIPHVSGQRVIIQDADLEYDPNDYYALVKPFETNPDLKVVFGSRYLLKKNTHSYVIYLIGGQLFTILFNFLYGQKLTDIATCYKVIDTKVLQSIKLNCERFEFCSEVSAKICKQNHKIIEVPISYHPRTFEEGKKLKWFDGFEYLWSIIKYRFVN
jgi:glycosyltransferase involved in cell wall biosynthesis